MDLGVLMAPKCMVSKWNALIYSTHKTSISINQPRITEITVFKVLCHFFHILHTITDNIAMIHRINRFNIKYTNMLGCKNSNDLLPLCILACNSANIPSFQNQKPFCQILKRWLLSWITGQNVQRLQIFAIFAHIYQVSLTSLFLRSCQPTI